VADDSAQQQARSSPEDRAALLDARIVAPKAGLELNPEQEKYWPPLESAIANSPSNGLSASPLGESSAGRVITRPPKLTRSTALPGRPRG
jgi:hypothetical protein